MFVFVDGHLLAAGRHTMHGNIALPPPTGGLGQIVEARIAIDRKTDWAAYRIQRDHLAGVFPLAIAPSGGKKRPLACDIHADMLGANPGMEDGEVRHFLRAYTYGPKYLRSLVAGAPRVALDGTIAGVVTPRQANWADKSLRAHGRVLRLRRVTAKVPS